MLNKNVKPKITIESEHFKIMILQIKKISVYIIASKANFHCINSGTKFKIICYQI